jgi:hypothetical protein
VKAPLWDNERRYFVLQATSSAQTCPVQGLLNGDESLFKVNHSIERKSAAISDRDENFVKLYTLNCPHQGTAARPSCEDRSKLPFATFRTS